SRPSRVTVTDRATWTNEDHVAVTLQNWNSNVASSASPRDERSLASRADGARPSSSPKGGSMRRDAVIGAVLAGWLAVGATGVAAQGLTHLPNANPKIPGVVQPNVLSPELAEVIRAQGAMLLENPVSPAKHYCYNHDRPHLRPLPPPD